MHKTLIKFCGITRPQDAALAQSLGADFLGMNFFAGPRKISRETAKQILSAVSEEKITPVALTACDHPDFPDAPAIDDIIGRDRFLEIANMQIYGVPADSFFSVSVWQVHSIGDRQSVSDLVKHYQSVTPFEEAMVLDAAVQGKLGGTGVTFDWKMLADALKREKTFFPKIVLAGGLNPDNVADAIRIVRPWAVDVSSGIESGSPGVKDPAKMKAFIEAVRAADRELKKNNDENSPQISTN